MNESIQKIVSDYSKKLKNKHAFFYPDIPKRILKVATTRYLMDNLKDEVLMVIDYKAVTAFITPTTLYVNRGWNNRKIDFPQIGEIAIKNPKEKVYVIEINGSDFFKFKDFNPKEYELIRGFASLLNSILHAIPGRLEEKKTATAEKETMISAASNVHCSICWKKLIGEDYDFKWAIEYGDLAKELLRKDQKVIGYQCKHCQSGLCHKMHDNSHGITNSTDVLVCPECGKKINEKGRIVLSSPALKDSGKGSSFIGYGILALIAFFIISAFHYFIYDAEYFGIGASFRDIVFFNLKVITGFGGLALIIFGIVRSFMKSAPH